MIVESKVCCNHCGNILFAESDDGSIVPCETCISEAYQRGLDEPKIMNITNAQSLSTTLPIIPDEEVGK